MTDLELNAVIQELVIQRNSFGDRALSLAAQLAPAQARIAELEKENAELKRESPLREVK